MQSALGVVSQANIGLVTTLSIVALAAVLGTAILIIYWKSKNATWSHLIQTTTGQSTVTETENPAPNDDRKEDQQIGSIFRTNL